MTHHARRSCSGREAASALVITLAIVTLLSVLLLGFLSGLRTETAATRTHVNGEQAILFAQMGADAAQARLTAAMPNVGTASVKAFPVPPDRSLTPASTPAPNVAPLWVAEPGRMLATSAGSAIALNASVDLSSGVSTAADDDAVDLNPPTLSDASQRLLTQGNTALFPGGESAMRVKWCYVFADGTFASNRPATPPTDPNKRIVGRFGFWVDDMSARINVNTAWTRSATSNGTSSQAHPSHIPLASLPLLMTPAMAAEPDAVNNYRVNQHPFNTLSELQAVDAATAPLPGQYALELAHASHALDLNLLGERRIVLTTQKSLAGDAEFLDILKVDNTDPGNLNNLDLTTAAPGSMKVVKVIRRIASLLLRTDWPVLPGAGFQTKYGGDQAWAFQMALNIIDYVRSSESSNPVVEPLRLDYVLKADGTPNYMGCNAASIHMVGNSRRPLITELGVWYGATSTQGCIYKVEIYLPKNSGFPSPAKLDLLHPLGANNDNPTGTKEFFLTLVAINPDKTTVTTTTPFNYPANQAPVLAGPPPSSPDGNAYLDGSSPYISEGECRTITFSTGWSSPLLSPGSQRPTRMLLSASLVTTYATSSLSSRVDNAPSTDDPTAMPIYAVDDKTVAAAAITSLSVNTDPRLNKDGTNFRQGPNTFGTVNNTSASLVAQPGLSAPQDTDTSGLIVTDSVRLSAPKGAAGNPAGLVSSVAELGYIHSGMQCRQGKGAGTPWRTLRLQAQTAGGASTLPDWVLTDLFAAPVVTTAAMQTALFKPTIRSTAGRINLNARIFPFADAANAPLISRLEPLRALFYGAKKTDAGTLTVTSTEADTLAHNVARYQTVSGATKAIPGNDNSTGVFMAPGQLAEIQGIGDQGEAGEALLREVGDLCTGRGGNVFSIYSIGQAVRQDKNGNVVVLGERRCQRVVERRENITLDPTKTPPQNETITAQFRAVYFRDLTP